jgi:hypothetical protein
LAAWSGTVPVRVERGSDLTLERLGAFGVLDGVEPVTQRVDRFDVGTGVVLNPSSDLIGTCSALNIGGLPV